MVLYTVFSLPAKSKHPLVLLNSLSEPEAVVRIIVYHTDVQ